MRRIRFLPGSIALLCVLAGVWSAPARAQSAFTPAAGTTTTVATGGTAVTAVTGPVRGCYIYNPPSATEALFVDPTKAATTTTGGTNTELAAGQPWNCPGQMPSGTTISVNAATAGHAFNVVTW